MSINIRPKADVSFLFSSLGSGAANVAGSNFLSDYASIKSGSYAKLMKAYYGMNSNDSVKSMAKSRTSNKADSFRTEEETKAYAKVQTASDGLKESADALLSKSLYEKKDITKKDENGQEITVNDYDTESIYKAVSSFVNDYNSVVRSAGDTADDTLARRVSYMESQSERNTKNLSGIGISINKDGTLALDKTSFMKADMTKVKSLFGGNGSYGYQVSAQASLINYAADHAASRKNSYTGSGSYSANFSNGNLFNSYF